MSADFKHRVEYKEYVEATQFSARITVLSVFFTAVIVGYLLAFYYLQVVQGDYFALQAEENRVRNVHVAPPRGALLDRFGRVIARNRPAFDVVLSRERPGSLQRTLSALAPILNLEMDDLSDRVARASNRPSHEPVVLGSDVELAVVAWIEAHRGDLPGVSIAMSMKRSYQEGDSGSHTLGYVGEVTRSMLETAEFADYRQGDIVGRTGIERTYNRDLQGSPGAQRVIVNSAGRVVGELTGSKAPTAGRDLHLTIDLDMQRELDAAFSGQTGAGVFLDPRTGEILAMTSRPGYDPNFFARRFNRQIWKGLVEDPRHPLQNRAMQSAYSPGSTFKPIMAAAGLEEGVITESTVFHCSGGGTFHGRRFLCHEKTGHGVVDMKKAIQVSCNVYFYNVGSRLGIDAIARYAKHIGLGTRTGVDIGQEVPGLVPTPEWKLKVHKDRWYPSETISVSIGQGPLLITPVQMAMAQGFIAVDGRRTTPHIRTDAEVRTSDRDVASDPIIGTHSLEVIRRAEWAVVNEWGTGTKARISGRDVCGKTGTAQVYAASAGTKEEDLPPEMRDHAWFVGFAPREDPRVSFAVIVEHGGHGGETAAPIVRRVLEKYFENAEGVKGVRPPTPLPAGQVAHAR